MNTPDKAQALLDLIAEQQATIINLRLDVETLKKRADQYRVDVETLKKRADQYREWWLDEQEAVKTLTAAATK
jgi:hypothetical protein